MDKLELTEHMRFALDKIASNGRTVFYRWPGDRWTDVKPNNSGRARFVNPVWFVNGAVIRGLERRALVRALGPDNYDPREVIGG